MTLVKRVGLGVTLGVDVTGSTTFVALGSIVGGYSVEAKASKAETSLLGDTVNTYRKTNVDPGELNFTIALDPAFTDYTTLAGLLVNANAVIPNWQVTFPAVAGGTSIAETFLGEVIGMGHEVKREGYATAKITIQKTGATGYA